MRLEIITHDDPNIKRLLSESPPKDGDTKYSCGLYLIGCWASRLEQHREFCRTPIGKYILKHEKK